MDTKACVLTHVWVFLCCDSQPLNHQSTSLHTHTKYNHVSFFPSVNRLLYIIIIFAHIQTHTYKHTPKKAIIFQAKRTNEWMNCVVFMLCNMLLCYMCEACYCWQMLNAKKISSKFCVFVCMYLHWIQRQQKMISSVGMLMCFVVEFCLSSRAFCLRMCQNKRSQLNNKVEIQFAYIQNNIWNW